MLTTEQKRAWQADATRGNALLVWNCFDYGLALLIVTGKMRELVKNADNVYVNCAYEDDESDKLSREVYAEQLSERLSGLNIEKDKQVTFSSEDEEMFLIDHDAPAAFDTIYYSGFFP